MNNQCDSFKHGSGPERCTLEIGHDGPHSFERTGAKMEGHHLYAHFLDCMHDKSEGHWAECPSWEELPEYLQKTWDRLAQCVTEGRGLSIGWEL